MNKDLSQTDPYYIDILDVAMDVVDCLLNSSSPQLPSELARQLNLNRVRVYRIIKNLERRGYVEADPDGRSYRLGLRFVEIGHRLQERMELSVLARPILSQLAESTGDAAHLLIRYQKSAICVDRYTGQNQLQVAAPMGFPFPLHIGASPKIILTYMPLDERETVLHELELKRFTQNTITDIQQLRLRLDEIRSRGYEVDEEDYELGTCAVGAPIFNHKGAVVAGITVTTPSIRFTQARKVELIEKVLEAAARVSARLGYSMPSKTGGTSDEGSV